jgi:putative ABC transport system permease protein
MFIRVYSEDYPNVLSDIEDIHNKFNPAYPFEYHFLDDEYNRLYKNEEQRSQIIGFFSIIAIFISCLGLYGLSSFIAIQKTKEIGIRKSNGAQVKDILQMFNRYFSKWILVAFILATPVSYYFMNRWLQNYAYNTNLEWHIFAISGAIAYIIALLTIGWQSWKAATKNPIDSLRYE